MARFPALQHDAIGLGSSVAIGVAGTSPSYSIAASTATLVGAVGILAPASLFYCGLAMMGIALAYAHLNRAQPDAGATFAWVSRIFNGTLGFSAGWAVLVSSAIFMVSATIPAAQATLLLAAPSLAGSRIALTLVALGWLLAISVPVLRGIAITGALQSAMTAIELTVLAALAITAWSSGHEALHSLSWSDFSPSRFDPATLASGALIALFFFWGWDVSLNVNEETRHARRIPGLGALLAILVITAAFVILSAATLRLLSDGDIRQSGTNVLFKVADTLFPRPWSYAAVLAVMLSTIGTIETSILQFSRTMFAEARAGALHPRWAGLHPRWKTPWAATLLIVVLGAAMLVFALLSGSVQSVLTASIEAIAVQAAYYYGLAGFACAWHFRRAKGLQLIFNVLWPAASAALLWAAALFDLFSFDVPTLLIAVGTLVVGFIVPALRR